MLKTGNIKPLSIIIVITAIILFVLYLFDIWGATIQKTVLVLLVIELVIIVGLIIKKHEDNNNPLLEKSKSSGVAKKGDDSAGKESDYSKTPIAVWSQIAATGLIGVAGISFTVSNSINESKRQQKEMATDLMANREQSETLFRQSMFEPLIKKIFDDTSSLEKRFSVFELFQNNFHDLFDSRSLYDLIWNTAETRIIQYKDSTNAKAVAILTETNKIKRRLLSLAKYTNAKQEALISISEEFLDTMLVCDSNRVEFYLSDDKEELISIQLLTASVDTLTKDIPMILSIGCEGEGKPLKINNGKKIHLSYFDSPLSNNFMLPDGHRIAVILKDLIPPNLALIRFAHFPSDYVTIGYRPSVVQVNELIDDEHEN